MEGYYDGLTGSCICAFDWYKISDLGWPWTADMHSLGEKIVFWSPLQKCELR